MLQLAYQETVTETYAKLLMPHAKQLAPMELAATDVSPQSYHQRKAHAGIAAHTAACRRHTHLWPLCEGRA